MKANVAAAKGTNACGLQAALMLEVCKEDCLEARAGRDLEYKNKLGKRTTCNKTNRFIVNEILDIVGDYARINHESRARLQWRVVGPPFACAVAKAKVCVQCKMQMVQPSEWDYEYVRDVM
jgi:hypothetical protein